MSPVKLLNNLLVMENFVGIFRNYCIQKKPKKCFIIFLIFVQTVLHTIIVFRELYLLLGELDYNQSNLIFAGFAATTYLSSVTSVMTGICYSRTFMSYFRNISRVSERFKDDKKLINSLKKIYWFSISFILFCIAFVVFRSVNIFLNYSQTSPLIMVPILASQSITRITIIFQHLLFCVVVTTVVHLLKCLTSLVSIVQESFGKCDISSDDQCDVPGDQIQEWVELYRGLADCCDKAMLCFGRQFLFSLILTTLHYILMSYNFFYNFVSKIGNTEEYSIFFIYLFGYVLVMMLPFVAGQMASNQGVKFRRVLVKLYNTMTIVSGEAEAKLIKDFIRLVKKNPIEIKLLTNIPFGMYILPVILTMAVNYLIVMLQFNHII